MRLVVVDTNVIVSAAISEESTPFKVVSEILWERRAQLVTCPAIVAEYEGVTSRGKFRRYGFPPKWLEFLLRGSLEVADPPAWPFSLPDPSDAPFLSLAYQAGAWLVTGNTKHFPVEARHGVQVVTPAEYVERIERLEHL